MTINETPARIAAVTAQAAAILHLPATRSTTGTAKASCGLTTDKPSTAPARYGLPASASRQAVATANRTIIAGWPRLKLESKGYQASAPINHSDRSTPGPGAASH